MKQPFALLLVVIMVISMAACSHNTSTVETSQTTSVPQVSEKIERNDAFSEHVTLRYVMADASENISGYDGWENILAAINQITEAKINATVELELIPLREYTNKMNMKYQTGEPWDVAFTGAWNPYSQAVAKGAFAELTPQMLEDYAPMTTANTNSAVWDALTIDGKIYGLPIQQIYVRQNGITVSKRLAEKYNLDLDSITSYDDMDTFLAAVAAGEGDDVVIVDRNAINDSTLDEIASMMKLDLVNGNTTPGAVIYDDPSLTVINPYATEEFRNLCYKLREWNEAGYFVADAITGADSASNREYAMELKNVVKPGGDVVDSAAAGFEVVSKGLSDTYMTTSAINATINAVNALSPHKERAVAFIDLLNNDVELLNLFLYGLEGQDYEFVDREAGLIRQTSDYFMFSFLVGNTFNAYYTDPAQVGANEATAELNANAKGSVLLGFTFNAEPVAAQIAQCNAVVSEYMPSLACGLVDVDVVLPEFLSKLEAAGASEIIAEMQAQVNTWAGK